MEKMTLRHRFIISSYISVVFSIIFICIVSYVFISNNSRKSAEFIGEEIVQQKKESISNRMHGLEVTIRDVIYSTELQEILFNATMDNADYNYMSRLPVNHIISRATNSLYMLDNIVIFSDSGTMLGSMFEFDANKQIQDYSWYSLVKNSYGETIWLDDTVCLTNDNYGNHMVISAVKKIRSVYNSDSAKIGQDLGYVFFTLNLDNMFNLNQLGFEEQGRKVYIVSKDARVLGGMEAEQYETLINLDQKTKRKWNTFITLNKKEYLLSGTYMDDSTGWSIVCLTEKSMILKDAYTTIAACVDISVVLLIVLGVVSAHNSEALCRPIKNLEKAFEMVEEGNFNIEIKAHTGISEMDNLFSHFYLMAYRLDNLIHEEYEAKVTEQKLLAETRQAQLHSLQMQINPHFLYNTLDSINWMALMGGNEEVSKMILALGHLFRNNIDTGGISTTARKEIENVNLYIYLEQVRFEGKLEFEVNADPEILDVEILKHILQPLVENSIKYGIEPYNRKGKVSIFLGKNEERVWIEVSDNGNGMQSEVVDALRKQWKDIANREDIEEKKGGVGIKNIMKRMWLYYGKQASFEINSIIEKGTKMTISFPIKIKKK